jgi:hypothetical protein
VTLPWRQLRQGPVDPMVEVQDETSGCAFDRPYEVTYKVGPCAPEWILNGARTYGILSHQDRTSQFRATWGCQMAVVLRDFLYLDGKVVRSYLASLEGRVFEEETVTERRGTEAGGGVSAGLPGLTLGVSR